MREIFIHRMMDASRLQAVQAVMPIVGESEENAQVALFLASDESSFGTVLSS